jgi:hypothetical protein
MASCGGDKVAIADLLHKGVVITDEKGALAKRISFKLPITVKNIYRNKDKLIINGLTETLDGISPSIIVTDLDGNILQETLLQLKASRLKELTIKKIFINNLNEIITFGSFQSERGNKLIMIKFDQHGNVIK